MDDTVAGLVEQLDARANAFLQDRDPAPVLEDETLRLLDGLRRAYAQGGVMPTAVAVTFAWTLWSRCLASQQPDPVELQEATRCFLALELIALPAVPEELRYPLPRSGEYDVEALLERCARLTSAGAFRQAAGYAYAAIHATPQDSTKRRLVLTYATFVLHTAFQETGDIGYAERARMIAARAIEEAAPTDPELYQLWWNFALAVQAVHEVSGDPADLSILLATLHDATEQLPPESRAGVTVSFLLSRALVAQYRISREDYVVQEALRYARRSVQALFSDSEAYERHLHLGDLHILSNIATHAISDLDGGIAAFRAAAAIGHGRPSGYVRHALFLLHRLRFFWYGRRRDFDAAVWWGEYATRLPAPDSPFQADDLKALGFLREVRSARGKPGPQHRHEVRDGWLATPLREPILAFLDRNDTRGLLAAEAPALAAGVLRRYRRKSGTVRARHLYSIAWFFWCRYLVLPDGAEHDDFRLACDYFVRVADTFPHLIPSVLQGPRAVGEIDVDPGHYRTLSHMESLLSETGNDLSDAELDDMAALLRRLLLSPATGRQAAALQILLAATLSHRHTRRRELTDLDDAIRALRAAAASPHTTAGLRLTAERRLMDCLGDRFAAAGGADHLDEAIAVAERSMARAESPRSRARRAAALSMKFWARFDQFGGLEDLERAVELARFAASEPEATDRIRSTALGYLGVALATRFDRLGERSDLDEAEQATRAEQRYLRADPDRSPEQWQDSRHNLSAILYHRYKAFDDSTDLDAAVEIGRELVSVADPGSTRSANYLHSYSVSLLSQAQRAGSAWLRDAGRDAARRALAAFAADDAVRPLALHNLARAARSPDGRYDGLVGLDEAIDMLVQAVQATHDGHPRRTRILLGLGEALASRWARDKSGADLHRAIQIYRAAAGNTAASTGDRIAAAEHWGRTAAAVQLWRTATEGYSEAVGLLPLAAWRGVGRITKERLLARWGDLTLTAASTAMAAERPSLALEILESGRTVLWRQSLDDHSDLRQLAEVRPDIAARLEAIRSELEHISIAERSWLGDIGPTDGLTADIG